MGAVYAAYTDFDWIAKRHGITSRAYESGALQLRLWPLRDFADGAYSVLPLDIRCPAPPHRCGSA